MKTLIRNAKIYDGTGSDPFVGDVCITNDRIEAIGKDLAADGDQVIDLKGKSLAPGFIDGH